jgi:hypothetical protein
MIKITNVVDKLPKHKTKRYRKRSLEGIEQIVIHHSAFDGDDMKAYARYHVDHHNWPGIGYTFMISRKGDIYMTNYLDTLCYNTRMQNTKSLGICFMGDYNNNPLSMDALDAGAELIKLLKQVLDIKAIIRHGDVVNTDCPGDKFPFPILVDMANSQ